MLISTAPKYTFKNIENKNIYCWENDNKIIISLSKLNEEDGKYKIIDKNDKQQVKETFKKLGVTEYHLDNTQGKLTEEKTSNKFYKDVPELTRLREENKKKVLKKTGNLNESFNQQTSQTHQTHNNINDLAQIAGITDRPIVEQNNEPSPVPANTKLYNSDVQINKDKMNNFFNKNKKQNLKNNTKLYEGKDDKIEFGKVEVKAEPGNLYNITIENLPGQDQWHAKFYGAILKYIENNLPSFLEKHPEVKDLQNYTKAELAGEEDETGEEEVDIGLSPESGEELPTDETQQANNEVQTQQASVPKVDSGIKDQPAM